MLISPINNTNFKSDILPTESLKQGFSLMRRSTKEESMKKLNSAKDFLDSLAKIRESKKTPSFKIVVDKRRENYSYIKINGRRTSGGHNEWNDNINDDYLIVEGIKKYASKLEDIDPSYLDTLKAEIEKTSRKLFELEARYAKRIQQELEHAEKNIFGSTK